MAKGKAPRPALSRFDLSRLPELDLPALKAGGIPKAFGDLEREAEREDAREDDPEDVGKLCQRET